jgi:hypothetical protein
MSQFFVFYKLLSGGEAGAVRMGAMSEKESSVILLLPFVQRHDAVVSRWKGSLPFSLAARIV